MRETKQPRAALIIACLLILIPYMLMIDLKSISTDEGLRLGIINGGAVYAPDQVSEQATWSNVLRTGRPFAYQPLYFLIQNSVMRLTGHHDLVLFRSVNLIFFAGCLAGLIALSRDWRLGSRLFMLTLFSFNAYLFMHVLQIREYIAAVAFYIWSTWFVLRLDTRKLERPWADTGWFVGYGCLLILGFYLQSWVVFPAIGQFLFLVVRRPGDRRRFYAHMAVSYVIVLAATLPYVLAQPQKINVGRWATGALDLGPQLSTGFHLVLAGHLPDASRFTDFLFWFWLAFATGSTLVLLARRARSEPESGGGDRLRQGRLMLLCTGLSLAFQIGYSLAIENLPLWPRYFVIHYFFLTWLIALGFDQLWTLRSATTTPPLVRHGLTATAGAAALVLLVSAVFQTRSYYHDPYLDTGLTRESNWLIWNRDLARVLQPDDVVLTHDFIARSTLTAVHPLPNRVLTLPELATADLRDTQRLVYLESGGSLPERAQLLGDMFGHGFPHLQETKLLSADGQTVVPGWQVVVFTRD